MATLFSGAPLLPVALTHNELHRLAALLDQDAIQAEQEARWRDAESLAWRAAALREAAR